MLDVAMAGALLVVPRLLGASPRFTRITTRLALGRIGYGLLTRHDLGVVRVLPMRAHLALDAAGGAGLCALPFMLPKREKPGVVALAVGAGLVDLLAAPLTATQSKPAGVPLIQRTGAARERAPATARTGRSLPTASVADTLRVISRVLVPTIAKGPIIRRPAMVARAERKDLDTQAVRTLQAMRARYGSGPLMLKLPVRRQVIILDPDHVRRILDESPDPFSPASNEKVAALAHFQPKSSLISTGGERVERRRLNEQVLEHRCPVHHMAGQFLPIVDEEVSRLLGRVGSSGALAWDAFFDTWFCIVRRIVFGNAAREDRRITDLMTKLRSDGNWAFAKPVRTDLRDELHQRIRQYIERAEAGSLSAYVASTSPTGMQAAEQQIPQWLFAFDPAAMASFRALALLATHPQQLARAREESSGGAVGRPHRPFLRATVLESLRLWPTTPLLLRQTTRETTWENGVMPAGTSILIFEPFFHRDDQRLPDAHTFHPELWMEDDPEVKGFVPRRWPFAPFSGGPAHCPAQNLVLMLTSGLLAALIDGRTMRLGDPQRLPPGRLPGTLDNYTLRFTLQPAGVGASAGPVGVTTA